MVNQKLKLNDGREIPHIGLGTYLGKGLENVIKESINMGYRLIDTAFVYRNESDIGKALEEVLNAGNIKREDLFIVSKLWNTKHKQEDVIPAIKRSLSDLRLSYLDLYLVHWPFAMEQKSDDEYEVFKNPEAYIPIEDTWRAMEQCVEMGYAKSIGISNFNSIQIDRILKIARIKPVVNQVECNPYLSQEKLRTFCKERNIEIMAYSPFYAPKRGHSDSHGLNLFEEPIIKEIAKKHNKTASQVILRYMVQCGVVPIPKSDNLERLKLNIDIFDFALTSEEFERLRTLNKNLRCTIFDNVQDFKEYPFSIEF